MTETADSRVVVLDAIRACWHGGDDGLLPGAEQLVARYFSTVATADLRARSVDSLFGAMRAHWRLAADHVAADGDRSVVRAMSPDLARDGWASSASVLQVVSDDSPFLVDSVAMALRRCGHNIELIIHPVLPRAEPAGAAVSQLSFIHAEFERVADRGALDELEAEVRTALEYVRLAVRDWSSLRTRAGEMAVDALAAARDTSGVDAKEAAELLAWVAADHFTLLGAADFELRSDRLHQIKGSGLGVLHDSAGRWFAASSSWPAADVLLLTKSEIESVVHRAAPYDVIGCKRYDGQGDMIGERRLIGLYTSDVYSASPATIPVIRRKVLAVVARSGLDPHGHDGKELRAILEGYPRDELFAASIEHLFATAIGVVQIQERQRVRLFLRRDVHRRVWTAMVYLPRDRYNTDVRRRVEAELVGSLAGARTEYTALVGESALARLYFVIHLPSGAAFEGEGPGSDPVAGPGPEEIEHRLALAARSWTDAFGEALAETHGEADGRELFGRYRDSFPASFVAAVAPATAAADVACLEQVRAHNRMALHVQTDATNDGGAPRIKLYVPHRKISLAELLPMLTNLGLDAIDESATEIRVGESIVWLHDLGISAHGTDLLAPGVDARLEAAFVAVWGGETRDDAFNRLVLGAALSWREVQVLRTYTRYLRQLGFPLSQEYVEATLVEQPTLAAQLVALFHARFDPAIQPESRNGRIEDATKRILVGLEEVAALDQDRILRALVELINATVRTNWYQIDAAGARRETVSLKLAPSSVSLVPLPRPQYEIFMHSPRLEAVHLRMGPVSRGGIRWSERLEDFRTEVLGLMKAQAVKNAVIVPAGAKGGFVIRRTVTERQAILDEVVACYRIFIDALLDLTDNRIDGVIVAPANTVRHDGDDPYLVVAADKGTATFSDTANERAVARGFWLGDAFASGGSAGYDHKAMGITARGAWESVKRHFHRIGRSLDAPFTAVGIGDMSGDVFGNGMLLSEQLLLVAAFDHRHVFVDPVPDNATSLAERRRLFALPRSSWDDYDRSVLSVGGGIWPRSAKAIELSPEARAVLGLNPADFRGPLTPAQLVSAVLRAPVDLLWNGGIGTYVKSTAESHADAGDRSNDAVRIDATDLRCRVIGEGGNLGLTQRARVEFAQRGGLVNTDAIDNSAGVDTSDHEVNLKILLDEMVARGEMSADERNPLLAAMTHDVAELVLADNTNQNHALANAISAAPAMIDVHSRYLVHLENVHLKNRARLDRRLEALPAAEVLLERRSRGEGLVVPELAVLLAYTKLQLTDELLREDAANDPAFHDLLLGYFPTAVRARFADAIANHPLHAEIAATAVVNAMANHNGVTFAFRMMEETHAGVPDIVRAHLAACKLFDTDPLWLRICALPDAVNDATQVSMLLEVDRLCERATRWLLRHRRLPLDVQASVHDNESSVRYVQTCLLGLMSARDRSTHDRKVAGWVADGVDQSLAERTALLELLPAALDIARLAGHGTAVQDVAAVYFAIDDRLGLGELRDRILSLPRNDRWDALARAALRDDLATEHAALASVVLGSATDLVAAQRLDAWASQHPTVVERYRSVAEEVGTSGLVNVATMSVVLRELRTLAVSR